MTQTALVTRIIDSHRAEVLVQRVTACGGNCEACGGACAAGARVTAVAANRVSAAAGDTVKLATHSAQILSAAALVYLLPLGTFFLGYFAAALAQLSEVWAIVSSVAGLFAGLWAVVLHSRRRRAITFEIVERL